MVTAMPTCCQPPNKQQQQQQQEQPATLQYSRNFSTATRVELSNVGNVKSMSKFQAARNVRNVLNAKMPNVK